MSVLVPERSLEQRMDALAKANRFRCYRARLKADIRTGERSFLAVLMVPPEECETMRVADLLLAVPGVGQVKVAKVFRRAGVAPSKTLAGLSDRQRLELSSLLRRYMRPVLSEAA